MNTHTLPAQSCHVLFDASLAPVLSIDSGQIVTFQTLDACWGEVRSIADFERYRRENRRGSNPLTGPVFIRGAAPGGTLRVDVLRIDLDATGFQLIGPNRALIEDEIQEWKCHLVHIKDNRLMLANGLTLPIDPVIGELGTAPAREATSRPNPCGGNLDCPIIRQGSSVYLPVQVEGALFSVGDVHARQGDGEIAGAPEIGAAVTLRLTVLPKQFSQWPVVEDADHWHMLASASTEAQAIRLAVFESARWVQRQMGLSLDDAMILLTMIAKIHCCRTGQWGDHGPVVAITLPKELLRQTP